MTENMRQCSNSVFSTAVLPLQFNCGSQSILLTISCQCVVQILQKPMKKMRIGATLYIIFIKLPSIQVRCGNKMVNYSSCALITFSPTTARLKKRNSALHNLLFHAILFTYLDVVYWISTNDHILVGKSETAATAVFIRWWTLQNLLVWVSKGW